MSLGSTRAEGTTDALSSEQVSAALVEVEDLSVQFRHGREWVTVVDRLTFDIRPGETVGLVGESGSGKSVSGLALLGLIAEIGGRISTGSVRLDGHELLAASERRWDEIRGRDLSMVFQQPTRSLNPAFRVGDQISETIRRHLHVNRREARQRAVRMLDRVHIADAARRARAYPHEFSGGQAQRIMIAMALACGPKLLVADEPTTALDVTVQEKVLALLRELQAETGVAILLISHDLAVIAETCQRVMVMYAGQVVEHVTTADIVRHPTHPYTAGLLDAVPRVSTARSRCLVSIPGTIPGFQALPSGCRFSPRCQHALPEVCTTEPIELLPRGEHGQVCRCARAADLAPLGRQR